MSAEAVAHSKHTLAESVWGLLDRADIRRADSDPEREAIYRLRHQAYVEEGAIRSRPDGRFTDPYDESDNAWIFGVYVNDTVVSSIRLHVATSEYPEMPSLDVFPDHLKPALDKGAIVIDPTRHSVDRQAALRYPNLVYLTMRLGWIAAEFFSSDIVLAAVRTEHQAFYRRIFGHRVVAPARTYPLLEKPISLMTLDYPAARDRVQGRFSFFRSTFVERRALFERLQQDSAPQAFWRAPDRHVSAA